MAQNLGYTGAETGDTSEIAATSVDITFTTDTDKVATGTYAYELDGVPPSASELRMDFTARDEVYVSAKINCKPDRNCSGGTNADRSIVSIRNGTTALAIGAVQRSGIDKDQMILWCPDSSKTVTTKPLKAERLFDYLTAPKMEQLELRYKKGTGSNAICELRYAGKLVASITDGTQTSQADNIFFNQPNGNNEITNIDDIRIYGDAWPGLGRVESSRPSAVGDDDNFSGTFADIDDDPIDDGTERVAPGSGATPFLNHVPNYTIDLNHISANKQWKVYARASRSGGQGRTHFLRWKKGGGTAENTADLGLTTGKVFYQFTPSDQPTTQAHVDDMQAGADQSDSGGQSMEVSEVWIMADVLGDVFVPDLEAPQLSIANDWFDGADPAYEDQVIADDMTVLADALDMTPSLDVYQWIEDEIASPAAVDRETQLVWWFRENRNTTVALPAQADQWRTWMSGWIDTIIDSEDPSISDNQERMIWQWLSVTP